MSASDPSTPAARSFVAGTPRGPAVLRAARIAANRTIDTQGVIR
jgi:hypothetical protein